MCTCKRAPSQRACLVTAQPCLLAAQHVRSDGRLHALDVLVKRARAVKGDPQGRNGWTHSHARSSARHWRQGDRVRHHWQVCCRATGNVVVSVEYLAWWSHGQREGLLLQLPRRAACCNATHHQRRGALRVDEFPGEANACAIPVVRPNTRPRVVLAATGRTNRDGAVPGARSYASQGSAQALDAPAILTQSHVAPAMVSSETSASASYVRSAVPQLLAQINASCCPGPVGCVVVISSVKPPSPASLNQATTQVYTSTK